MKEETEQSIETFQILFFITLIEISLTWMLNGMDTFWSLKLALNAIIGDAAVMLLITQNVALKEKMEIQKETKWLTAQFSSAVFSAFSSYYHLCLISHRQWSNPAQFF